MKTCYYASAFAGLFFAGLVVSVVWAQGSGQKPQGWLNVVSTTAGKKG